MNPNVLAPIAAFIVLGVGLILALAYLDERDR